ncbi:MAG TPA: response regulator, partial [Verrucomicrobiae bacterium]|nr:response regulator [Verrucomicrobiae bacterium]
RQNGFDVLAWIRKQTRQPKVVVLTSSPEPEDRARALDLHADAFMVKPRTVEGWKQVIASLDSELCLPEN